MTNEVVFSARRRIGRTRAAAWLVAVVALALGASVAAGSARAAAPLGVYSGGGNVAGVAAFGEWLEEPPSFVLDYLEWTTWSDIAEPSWLLDQWEGQAYSLVLSVPMLPNDGSTLLEGTTGIFDQHFTQLAENLVERGLETSVIRLGWEFNHEWFPWYAGADPASFVAYWRRIADTMRAVDGAAFTFEWSANLGGALALETVYPGDAYVDTIGLDVYNHDWHPGWQDPVTRWNNLRSKDYGLDWHRDFATTHGKQVSFPEWGMIVRLDGHGGGDDAYFIEQMHDWIEEGDTAFHVYFDVDTPETVNSMSKGWFPTGALRYRELFGAPLPDPPPADPAAPPPPVVPAPITRLISAAEPAPKRRQSLGVRAIVRPIRSHLRIALRKRGVQPIRRIDVLLDGRRVCRSRRNKHRCPRLRLAPGRHRIVLRVHTGSRRKISVARTVVVGSGTQKRFVLRI